MSEPDFFQQFAERTTDRKDLQAQVAHYYRAAVAVDGDVCDILGRALRYEDDPEYGLNIGDHVAQSLAMQAARELTKYRKLLLDLKQIHFPRGKYCNQCGGGYPCSTVRAAFPE